MNKLLLVFDFNGTLYFDNEENREAWNITSKKFRGSFLSEEEIQKMNGRLDRECSRIILPSGSNGELDNISREKEEIYFSLCKEHNLLLDKDAVSFLDLCLKEEYEIAICSSCPKMNMEWYIKNLNLLSYFKKENIICGMNNIKSKPSSDIYLYTAKKLKRSTDECICFEDSVNGLKSALSAKYKKVYAISSPSQDTSSASKLAPLITWKWACDNFESIVTF